MKNRLDDQQRRSSVTDGVPAGHRRDSSARQTFTEKESLMDDLSISKCGVELLHDPTLNKSTAFTEAERRNNRSLEYATVPGPQGDSCGRRLGQQTWVAVRGAGLLGRFCCCRKLGRRRLNSARHVELYRVRFSATLS
jgi:hypothetical protein